MPARGYRKLFVGDPEGLIAWRFRYLDDMRVKRYWERTRPASARTSAVKKSAPQIAPNGA